MTLLLSYLLRSSASADQRKFRCYILPLHYAYALLLVAGIVEISSLGGDPDQSALPLSFIGKDLLMVLSFAILLGLKSKKFLLEPGNLSREDAAMDVSPRQS